jgi:hypothetical protein
MTPHDPHDPDETLALLQQTLRGLPLRRAPATLESRVLGELQRRAALPWWRRSFAHWPAAARAVFVVICAALVLGALGGTAAVANVHSLSWLRQAGGLLTSLGYVAAVLIRPAALPSWIYGGIAVCAVLYAVLFGLGAAVYRTLYLPPPVVEKIL